MFNPCPTCQHRHNPSAQCPVPVNAGAPNIVIPATGHNGSEPASSPQSPPAAPPNAMTPEPPAAPAGAPAGIGGGSPVPARAAAMGLSETDFYRYLEAAHNGNATTEIRNALADITQSGAGVDVDQPDFVGQLWQGADYDRKVVPLIAGKPLTSYKVTGWRWVTKPAVAAYAGDKAAVTSNAADTEPYSVSASRLAGAHDIDRKFRDFNDTAFFEAYYRAMTDSYARLSDAAAVDGIEAVATAIPVPGAGFSGFLGAIAKGVSAIDDATNIRTTFVLANKTDLIPWALTTTNFDVPAFLELIGVDPRRIVSHNSVAAGTVVVGTSSAVKFRELGGSAPIRVEAINMANAGVDAGVFGYYLLELHSALGLQKVTIAP